MKKTVLLLTLTMCFSPVFFSCTKKEKKGFTSEISNPMVSFSNINDVNDFAATDLRLPERADVSKLVFYGLKTDPKLGEVRFTSDGISYTYRAARTERDISGVYYMGKTLGDSVPKGENQTPALYGKGCWARWFRDGVQYSLYAEGEENLLTLFEAVYDELAG